MSFIYHIILNGIKSVEQEIFSILNNYKFYLLSIFVLMIVEIGEAGGGLD